MCAFASAPRKEGCKEKLIAILTQCSGTSDSTRTPRLDMPSSQYPSHGRPTGPWTSQSQPRRCRHSKRRSSCSCSSRSSGG
eukprot:3266158-Pyramimonas_sp.AAC.1